MTKLIDLLDKAMEKIVALLCVILLLCLFVEVVNRYVFFVSWPEIQFIIPFCFLWMCMIGAALAVRRGQHFEVDLLQQFLPDAAKKIHKVIMQLSVLAAGAVIAWSSISFVNLGLIKKNSATGIPMIYIYASLLVGSILILVMALDRLFAAEGAPSDDA
ncbi:TRAP transporter small permease [Roseibium aggregatum]|uniref:TRAP transporter small permease n=1 Tax=Roseibium aggregatum TaxID=187304 RepID=UPI0025AD5619|nr:TRAP transporter small permease [Roseibium aggregatum]WJS05625.1 TRAP transporter small permease [Roseibium aggregatum]